MARGNLKTALVTGGNGYLGSVLVRHLVECGFTVHAIAHKNRQVLDRVLPEGQIHVLTGDLSDTVELTGRLKPDAIFHLATDQTEPKDIGGMLHILQNNLALGTALLQGAALCPKSPVFLNAGTYWQFADPDYIAGNSFYAATKQAFHDILLYFRRAYKIRSTTLILYDTIGLTDPRSKLWNKLVEALPGTQFPMSGGKQTVDIVHVDDIVRGFVHAANLLDADELPGPLYALRSNEPKILRDFIEDLSDSGILDLQFVWGKIPYWSGQIFQVWQGERLPGWRAAIDIKETIAEMARRQASNRGILRD